MATFRGTKSAFGPDIAFFVDDDGIAQLDRLAKRLEETATPQLMGQIKSALAKKVVAPTLFRKTKEMCEQLIYDTPEPTYIDPKTGEPMFPMGRTEALLDAHESLVYPEGIVVVRIDPEAVVERPEFLSSHGGTIKAREVSVAEYADALHNGYTQYVFGNNTYRFREGLFWMTKALSQNRQLIVKQISLQVIKLLNGVLKKGGAWPALLAEE